MNGLFNSIFSAWDFGTVHGMEPINHQVWKVSSQQGDYILKRKPNSEHVQRERSVLEHLRTHGVAAHTVLGEFQLGDEWYALYEFLPGKVLQDDIGFGEKVGEEIGRLHRALQDFPRVNQFRARNVYEGTYTGVLNGLASADVNEVRNVGTTLRQVQEDMLLVRDLPQQLIHRDLNRNNVIFDGDQCSGFVDFDLMESNVRTFDPCYFAASLLAHRFDDVPFRQDWLQLVKGIFGGYNRINPLSPQEKGSIWFVMYAIEALFAALFVKNSPDVAKRNASICLWLFDMRSQIEVLQFD